jgi:hypothetical protein
MTEEPKITMNADKYKINLIEAYRWGLDDAIRMMKNTITKISDSMDKGADDAMKLKWNGEEWG